VFNRVGPTPIQAALRELFGRWGRPAGLRLDNGLPWGGRAEQLPTALALWLVGLGLRLTFNPPRQPRYNGVVEKSHDTNARWTEPHTAASAAEWQARVDAMDRRQREAYPYLGRRSRLEVFPGLTHSGRAYSRAWEEQNWHLGPVREYLARQVVPRRVSSQGRVCLYNRERYVGLRHALQDVLVSYDPDEGEWLVTQEGRGPVARLAAPEVCQDRIINLTLSTE
jgi:hypothetical protein